MCIHLFLDIQNVQPANQPAHQLANNLVTMDVKADNLAFKPPTFLSKWKAHDRNSLSLNLQSSNSSILLEPHLDHKIDY